MTGTAPREGDIDRSERATGVVFLIDSLGGGGAERSVLLVAEAMLRSGHPVLLTTLNPNSPYRIPDGLEVVKLSAPWSYKLRHLAWGLDFRARLRDWEARHGTAGLITAHIESSHQLAAAARVPGVRYVFHNALTPVVERTRAVDGVLAATWLRHRWRWRYRGCIALPVSRGVARDIEDNGIRPSRTVVIHNPVDVARIRGDAREPNPFAGMDYVVHVGRFVPEKRHDLLLQAFARVRANDLHLVLLGQGPLQPSIEASIGALGLSGRVHLTGFRANPFPIVRGARLLALTSDTEGFPMVVLEAMATETPVLATDPTQELAELFSQGGGRVLPDNDPDIVARELQALVDGGAASIPPPPEGRLSQFSPDAVAHAYLTA